MNFYTRLALWVMCCCGGCVIGVAIAEIRIEKNRILRAIDGMFAVVLAAILVIAVIGLLFY